MLVTTFGGRLDWSKWLIQRIPVNCMSEQGVECASPTLFITLIHWMLHMIKPGVLDRAKAEILTHIGERLVQYYGQSHWTRLSTLDSNMSWTQYAKVTLDNNNREKTKNIETLRQLAAVADVPLLTVLYEFQVEWKMCVSQNSSVQRKMQAATRSQRFAMLLDMTNRKKCWVWLFLKVSALHVVVLSNFLNRKIWIIGEWGSQIHKSYKTAFHKNKY